MNRVVADAKLHRGDAKARDANRRGSPLIIGIGQRAFFEQIDLVTAKAYDSTKDVTIQNATAMDAQEGIGAFLGKAQTSLVRQVVLH